MALPHYIDAPSCDAKQPLVSLVPTTIRLDLMSPECTVRLRGLVYPARMAVPEAAVNEYDRAVSWEYEIWPAG